MTDECSNCGMGYKGVIWVGNKAATEYHCGTVYVHDDDNKLIQVLGPACKKIAKLKREIGRLSKLVKQER